MILPNQHFKKGPTLFQSRGPTLKRKQNSTFDVQPCTKLMQRQDNVTER